MLASSGPAAAAQVLELLLQEMEPAINPTELDTIGDLLRRHADSLVVSISSSTQNGGLESPVAAKTPRPVDFAEAGTPRIAIEADAGPSARGQDQEPMAESLRNWNTWLTAEARGMILRMAESLHALAQRGSGSGLSPDMLANLLAGASSYFSKLLVRQQEPEKSVPWDLVHQEALASLSGGGREPARTGGAVGCLLCLLASSEELRQALRKSKYHSINWKRTGAGMNVLA